MFAALCFVSYAAYAHQWSELSALRDLGKASLAMSRMAQVMESIPNALLLDLGSYAVQPRAKVGIWYFAVINMSLSVTATVVKQACSAKI
jgi:hypothetical protein